MFNFKKLLGGDENKKFLKEVSPIIEKINFFEDEISALSDDDLKSQTNKLKNLLSDGKTLDDILPEAFATVREVSKRLLEQRHYDVQLIGGVALHRGKISQMRTGEGKTLVATLPVYLNALNGKGVHVVTVNDYLSKRDAVWMGQIYDFLGLSVGIINSDQSFLYDRNVEDPNPETPENEADKQRDEEGSFKVVKEFLKPCSRKESYSADITYGTNNEFGFDYLRDNIERKKEDLRQREYNFAIVDEIDSILIDEARTPLIISAPAQESEDLYKQFSLIANILDKETDYKVDEKLKAITLTDEGIEKVEKKLNIDNIYTEKGIKFVHHLETAVRAKALFEKDKDYVVKDGQIIIVDEFTGRLQPGRRWSEGLHQAIEAKEGVEVQRESRTFASITFQNYFRMYDKLAGMTGTAKSSEEEFYKVYGLEVIEVPTNKVPQRIDREDLIFQSEKGKFVALAKKVKELNERGQPVLIGTVSIEKNELLSAFLKKEGITHEILNAKNHEKEGEIIASAGEIGKVTVATNMAGRGVDIKLGGVNANQSQHDRVSELGGLFVMGTERHESRRIDDQLRGRCGRQGDKGETQFFVSMEDSLMRVFATDVVKKMMGKLGIPEDQPIENKIITKSLESAQQKIEGFNFDSRRHVLQYDDVLNFQRNLVYTKRRRALMGNTEELEKILNEMLGEVKIHDQQDFERFNKIKSEKLDLVGKESFYENFKNIYLQMTDLLWVEHLEVMDYTRNSVNLRAYGQRDPLVEYKRESLRLFKEMEGFLLSRVLETIDSIGQGAFMQERQRVVEVKPQENIILGDKKKDVPKEDNEYKNVGRNDPCPCGSGKKYKKCHGK